MQTLRDFMRVCSHAKKKEAATAAAATAAVELTKKYTQKCEQRSWTGTQDDYPVIHLLPAKEQVKKEESVAVTQQFSVTLPAGEVVLPQFSVWTCLLPMPLPCQFFLFAMLICGLTFFLANFSFPLFFLVNFWYNFCYCIRSQLGRWSGHFVFFDNLLQLPNWPKTVRLGN